MQNQKTAPTKTDISELDLSPQEQVFAEQCAINGNQSEAYKKAYGAGGYAAPSLHVKACRKAAEPKIKAYIASLRSAGAARGRISIEQRIEEERAFAVRCEQAGNMGAAGGAHDRINKLLGLYVERHEQVTTDDPMQALAAIAKEYGEETARQLAVKQGINWHPAQVNDAIQAKPN